MNPRSGDITAGPLGAQWPRRGSTGLIALVFALGLALALAGYLLAAAAVLGLSVFVLTSRHLLSWSTLLSAIVLAVMLIPANLYSLPASLPIDIEVYRLFVFALFASWAAALLTDEAVRFRPTPLDGPMLAVAFVVILSFVANLGDFEPLVEFGQSAKGALYVLTFIMMYYCIVSVVTDNALAIRLVRLIVYLAAVLAILAVVERLTGFNVFRHLHEFVPLLEPTPEVTDVIYRGGLRVSGSLAHPIAFGTLLALVLPLPIELLLESKTLPERVNWGGLSALITVGALLSVSRTAVIGIVAIFISLAITRPRNRTALLICSAVVAVAIHMFFPGVIGRFVETLTPSRVIQRELAAGEESRLADYPKIAAQARQKPLVGRGVGTFTPDRFFYVDNQYLKYLVEIGVLGMLTMLYLFAASTRRLVRQGRRMGGEAGAIVSAVGTSALVYALVNATFDAQGFPQVPYLFFMLLALAVAIWLNAAGQSVPASPSDTGQASAT